MTCITHNNHGPRSNKGAKTQKANRTAMKRHNVLSNGDPAVTHINNL
jgi:hypothetical protein